MTNLASLAELREGLDLPPEPSAANLFSVFSSTEADRREVLRELARWTEHARALDAHDDAHGLGFAYGVKRRQPRGDAATPGDLVRVLDPAAGRRLESVLLDLEHLARHGLVTRKGDAFEITAAGRPTLR